MVEMFENKWHKCVCVKKKAGIPVKVHYIYRRYNKVQACFSLETFYSEFSPLRALSRPSWLD